MTSLTPAQQARWEARVFQYVNSLPLSDKQRLWDSLNRAVDRSPMGSWVRNTARNKTMGLSGGLGDWGAALATGITALATTAVGVGLSVYDKRKDQEAATQAENQQAAIAMATIKAQQQEVTQVQKPIETYALWGAGALAALGIIVFGVVKIRTAK